ncbi:MAG: hypothetical protein IKV88_06380 [Clostridia bacterium]|nr:hypothetical protein [Clostridia bacterium]
MKLSELNLINPPKKYRPMPFWSWNSKLDEKETILQIEEMDKAGMGGYFMHARGGLKTEYMGDEWMNNIRAAIEEGKKRGMSPWGYDENGWPSGSGSGEVNGIGEEYQQKFIHMEITQNQCHTDHTIFNKETPDGKNMHFYYSVNRFYVDAMDGKVTDAFIASTHEKYKSELGEDFSSMTGFFTDEPLLSRVDKAIPWSLIIPKEYERAYGRELLPVLDRLFIEMEDSYSVRFRFWKLVTKLFSENFMKKVYDWCNDNNSRLTGHMVQEETMSSQIDSNGACMPNYMYMHIPGVDKLGKSVFRNLLSPQVTSVCAQTGKKQILTESYALCGWDISFEDMKWILEWQMAKGVNLLCQHLWGYSLGGVRKRDHPAFYSCQNFWWDDYRVFNDFASRVGMLLAEGEIKCDTLVLHTISSGWIRRCDDHNWKEKTDETLSKALTDIMEILDKSQIIHHLGDEVIMEKIASVSDGKLKIGEMEYSTVIIPSCLNLFSNTLRLLKEFSDQGGRVIFTGEIPSFVDGEKNDEAKTISAINCEPCELVGCLGDKAREFILTKADGSHCDVQYALRCFEDFSMHYLVNTYSKKEEATFETKGQSLARFDYVTGEIVPYPFKKGDGTVSGKVAIEEKGSMILFTFDDDRFVPFDQEEKHLLPLGDELKGQWQIKDMDKNAITFDQCSLTIDGEKIADKLFVTDIEEIANSYERQVRVSMEFEIVSETDLEGETFLVMEESEFYEISINGEKLDKKLCGYYRDKDFDKLDISGTIKRGKNTLVLTTDFVQPRHIYETIRDCHEFAAARNKLWYDREIEEIYILGDFSVCSASPYTETPGNSLSTKGSFYLDKKKSAVTDGDLVHQGLPFHCGSITLQKKICLDKTQIRNRSIKFSKPGSVITKVTVNGIFHPPLLWAPYDVDLSNCLKEGENTIEIELISNFRNLLGPLHNGCDSGYVAPGSFYKNTKIFAKWPGVEWNDDYSFLKKGLFFEQ